MIVAASILTNDIKCYNHVHNLAPKSYNFDWKRILEAARLHRSCSEKSSDSIRNKLE